MKELWAGWNERNELLIIIGTILYIPHQFSFHRRTMTFKDVIKTKPGQEHCLNFRMPHNPFRKGCHLIACHFVSWDWFIPLFHALNSKYVVCIMYNMQYTGVYCFQYYSWLNWIYIEHISLHILLPLLEYILSVLCLVTGCKTWGGFSSIQMFRAELQDRLCMLNIGSLLYLLVSSLACSAGHHRFEEGWISHFLICWNHWSNLRHQTFWSVPPSLSMNKQMKGFKIKQNNA